MSDGCFTRPQLKVGEVQQAIDAAEIDERAVLSHVLHVPVNGLAFAQRLHQLCALGVQLFFHQCPPAHHDIAASAVQLGDAHLHFGVQQVVEVLRRAADRIAIPGETRARRYPRPGRP